MNLEQLRKQAKELVRAARGGIQCGEGPRRRHSSEEIPANRDGSDGTSNLRRDSAAVVLQTLLLKSFSGEHST